MPRIRYSEQRLSARTLERIAQANEIIGEYNARGFALTLRQLYYQFVARDLIPNTLRSYKRLGDAIVNGRMCGLIDWDAIIDRTRGLRGLAHWERPAEIVAGSAAQFRVDRWANQKHRPEIWIEKDALVGVIERVCAALDVPYFSCRGYGSISEMWSAASRLRFHLDGGQTPIIFHFGDHDPSGLDMTRCIGDQLEVFGIPATSVEVRRLALNRDQVRQYNPPANPAKQTDSRFKAYARKHGRESWELDALDPSVLETLIRGQVEALIDREAWDRSQASIDKGRAQLTKVAEKMRGWAWS